MAKQAADAVDQYGDPICCCGKSKKEWRKYAAFYFVYYSSLVVFFAISYSVMYATLPNGSEGPKTQYIIKPGATTIPADFGARGITNANFDGGRYNRTVDDFFNRAANFEIESKLPLRLTDQSRADVLANGVNATRLGACGTREGAKSLAVNDKRFCIYAKINRVYNFAPASVSLSLNLGFPSAAVFQNRYGVPFSTVFTVEGASTVPPSYFPFRNGGAGEASPFIDAVVAFTVNAGAVLVNGTSPALDARVNVDFDWGQAIDDGNGRAEFTVDIRP